MEQTEKRIAHYLDYLDFAGRRSEVSPKVMPRLETGLCIRFLMVGSHKKDAIYISLMSFSVYFSKVSKYSCSQVSYYVSYCFNSR